MGVFYAEIRPAYTGVVNYPVQICLDGVGQIGGMVFSLSLNDPNGNVIASPGTVVIIDPNNRIILATISGQSVGGEYQWSVRRTDDGSGDVVAWGIVDVTQLPFPVP